MENGQSVFFLSPHTPYGRVRLARFARVRLLRHALPISLLTLRKLPTVLQSMFSTAVMRHKQQTSGRLRTANNTIVKCFFKFMLLVSVSFHLSCPSFDCIRSIDSTSHQVLLSKEYFLWSSLQRFDKIIFCLSPLLLMRIRCQFFPSWILFEHSNFSLRLQPHSPIKPDWRDLRDLNFDCIQFSGFRS